MMIKDFLTLFCMEDSSAINTSLSTDYKSAKLQKDVALKLPYRELIGPLLYLANTCRLNVMFSVSKLLRYMDTYSTDHWKLAKRVLRY